MGLTLVFFDVYYPFFLNVSFLSLFFLPTMLLLALYPPLGLDTSVPLFFFVHDGENKDKLMNCCVFGNVSFDEGRIILLVSISVKLHGLSRGVCFNSAIPVFRSSIHAIWFRLTDVIVDFSISYYSSIYVFGTLYGVRFGFSKWNGISSRAHQGGKYTQRALSNSTS